MKILRGFAWVLLCSLMLCACGGKATENVPGQSDDSTGSGQNGKSAFLAMANHDTYMIGTVVGSSGAVLSESYITVDVDGKEYRVEGLCWDKAYTQTPFSVATGENLEEEYAEGAGILIFYDNDHLNGNVIRPKDIYVTTKEEDLAARAQGIKRIAGRLADNCEAMADAKFFTPEEAMAAFIEAKGLGPAVEGTDKYGAKCYICGNYRLSYGGVLFSECFGMTDEAFIRYYEETHFEYPHFLENLNLDTARRSEPYVKYRIVVETYEGEEHLLSKDTFCYVDMNGNMEDIIGNG